MSVTSHPGLGPRSAFSSTTSGSESGTDKNVDLRNMTLGDVQDQMALSAAYRAMHKDAKTSAGGVLYAASRTLSTQDNPKVLMLVAAKLTSLLFTKSHLFMVLPSNPRAGANPVVLCGSSQDMVNKAVMYCQARFGERWIELPTTRFRHLVGENIWLGSIEGLDISDPYDEKALWNILEKSTDLSPPTVPPAGSISIDEMLERARAKISRLTPKEAYIESSQGFGAFLVDIRPEAQRSASGGIPRALVIERNVLEWRFDPRSSARLPIADRYDIRVIVFCEEGYTSSLAAAALQELGLKNATDINGGYQAWLNGGLPTTRLRLEDDF